MAQVHCRAPMLSAGVSVTTWLFILGFPPRFPLYVIVICPPVPTWTLFTNLDVICVFRGKPASALEVGKFPVAAQVSATASFAAAARFKPSVTFERTV